MQIWIQALETWDKKMPYSYKNEKFNEKTQKQYDQSWS